MGKVNQERLGLIREDLDKMGECLLPHNSMAEGIRVSFETLHKVSELLVDFIEDCKDDHC